MGRKRSRNSSVKRSANSSSVSTRPDLENSKRYSKNTSGDDFLAQDGCSANSSSAATDISNPMLKETCGTGQGGAATCASQNSKFSTNMVPEFDPSDENNRIDTWLSKVNECATKYRWDEEHTMYQALSKLGGCAKVWLRGQTCVSHSWARWQDLLLKAFPCTIDYSELLTVMLDCRLKCNEDLEEYYYDKMALLHPCDIHGEKAVDCIIHGIDDFRLRAMATAAAAQCAEPERLLNLLKDIHDEQSDIQNRWCI